MRFYTAPQSMLVDLVPLAETKVISSRTNTTFTQHAIVEPNCLTVVRLCLAILLKLGRDPDQ